MGDGRLGEVAVLIVGKLSTYTDRVVGVRLQIGDLMHRSRLNLYNIGIVRRLIVIYSKNQTNLTKGGIALANLFNFDKWQRQFELHILPRSCTPNIPFP